MRTPLHRPGLLRKFCLLSGLVLLFTVGTLRAQTDTTNRWNAVQSRAKAEGKPVLVYFSGSDWCGSCMQFKKNILADSAFAAYLSASFAYYNADFPVRKKQDKQTVADNELLSERYNTEGSYPAIVIVSADGQLLGRIAYTNTKTVNDYIAELKKITGQ